MRYRLAHFSDIHLTHRPLGWTRRDLFSKKVAGWVNIKFLGRGARFRHASRIVSVLVDALNAGNYDAVIFSGDATKMAFPSEFRTAQAALAHLDVPLRFAVPGNHDRYSFASVHERMFEQHFGDWQNGIRLDDHEYPFATKVGDAWLIGLDSAIATRWMWDSTGFIDEGQLERLLRLCKQLDPGPRFVVTHYPLRRLNGKPEMRLRRLRNHARVCEVMKQAGISLYLHGHIHRGFVSLPDQKIPFPLLCSGSATQTNRWMYNEYEVNGSTIHVTRWQYDFDKHAYQSSLSFEVELAKSAGADSVLDSSTPGCK